MKQMMWTKLLKKYIDELLFRVPS